MGQFKWDESVEELCSSAEEIQKLKEVASLLCNMPKVQSSSSFQSELRARLMEKALSEEISASEKNKWRNFMHKGFKYSEKIRLSSPLIAAAAVFFLVISLTVFYNKGMFKPYSAPKASEENVPEIIVEPHPDSSQQEQYIASAQQEPDEVPPEENVHTPVDPEENLSEITTPADSPPPDKPPVDNPVQAEPETETERGEDAQSQPVKMDPEFEALKDRQSFQLAGQINLPPVYYGAEEDAGALAENVSCSWSPRKIVFSTDPAEARIFGTEAWAKETLSNNGFIVREGDYLQVNLQETQKGLFAELFYRPQKSEGKALTLVLHCQEGLGIISYYYKEEGEAAKPGFYPLLSPAEAFKQVDALKWFATSQRLNFSFQEVVLTYGDFLLEQNGRQETVKLPAYRFLGMETLHSGGEIRLLLPAVK